MLPVKSKYKIGKRLGPAVFEQCQTQKFALSEARSAASKRGRRAGSDYGRQLLEKQRIRYTYGLSEKQLSNYAHAAMGTPDPSNTLHRSLEMRLDSTVYRLGLAPTRRAARQMVSHGHIVINDVRTTVPSHRVRIGDSIKVREGSRASTLFSKVGDPEGGKTPASWLSFDAGVMRAEVKGEPSYTPAETALDYPTLFEFYSR
jgi:small subunit ribosomal protein S4